MGNLCLKGFARRLEDVIDWFITTPTMLVSTIIFMEYLRHARRKIYDILNFWTFLQDHKEKHYQNNLL